MEFVDAGGGGANGEANPINHHKFRIGAATDLVSPSHQPPHDPRHLQMVLA
jgi:hypothetical protein